MGQNDVVHAWVQRDDLLYGFPIRGRQAYFNNDCYVRFDSEGRDNETDDPACVVQRGSTINAIATGQYPVVIGGYLRKEKVAAKYSSSGPVYFTGTVNPNPCRPDVMFVSEDSRVHTGVLAAGSRSGSAVAMGGTSVAAPQVARLIADDLAASGVGGGDRATVHCKDRKTPERPPGAGASNNPQFAQQGSCVQRSEHVLHKTIPLFVPIGGIDKSETSNGFDLGSRSEWRARSLTPERYTPRDG